MAEHPNPENPDRLILDLLSQGSYRALETCWELYQEISYISEPEGYYFTSNADTAYNNLAVIGEGRIVDIEADENGNDKHLTVSLCRAYSGVNLFIGPIPTLARTQGSLLTVACRTVGAAAIGHYWVARDEEESTRLRRFAKVVVKAISKG